LVSELLGPQCSDQHSPTRRRPHPRQAVVEGNARRMERRGSSFLGEVPAPAVGGNDKLGTIMSNQTQSSLACLGTTTSIAAAAAITKASVQDPVREGSARVLLEVVNVTIARPSLISMETFMERAEERTTQGARGATQLGGVTQDVETYSLQAGSQATPGPTEHAPLVVDLDDTRRNNKNNNNNMINGTFDENALCFLTNSRLTITSPCHCG